VRWPFANWLRGAPGGDYPSPSANLGAGSAGTPDPGPSPRAAARPAAWRDAPPLQRAVGEAPLTAPSAAFSRDLAGRRTLEPMLAPLGHDLTADGPAGMVSGIAVPLVQRAPLGSDGRPVPALPPSAAPGPGRPTARRAVASVATMPQGQGLESATAGAVLEETAADDIAGSVADGPPAEVPLLLRRILPVAQTATSTPALAATRVADETAPAPMLAVARAVARTVAPGATGGSREALVEGPSVTATDPAPGSAPGESVAATPPAPARPDDPARPVGSRRTLGESRRLGLGAPLPGRPPSTAIEPGRADLPVVRMPRSTDSLGRGGASAAIAPAMPPAAAAPAPLPRLVVARRAATAPGFATIPPTPDLASATPTAAGASDPGRAGAPAEAPSEAVGEPSADEFGPAGKPIVTRPLLGESAIGVSRLARDTAAADADGEAASSRGPALPLDRSWGSAAAEPDSEPTVGRWPESGAAPPAGTAATTGSPAMTGSPATEFPTHTPGFTALQRSLVAPAGGDPARSASSGSAARTTAPLAPLVPGRAMRASQPGAISTLGFAHAGDAEPIVARLAISSPGTGGGGSATGPAAFGYPAGSPSLRAPAAGTRRDDRPVASRVAQAGGAGPTSAATPTLTLSRLATGSATPDDEATGRPDGGTNWIAGTGFTTVAAAAPSFVQRAVTIDEMTVAPAAAAAGAAGTGAPAPGAAAGPGGAAAAGGAGTDYEEIAEHVYDRIHARLTTELLLDRERAGMLVDG
jgi:hypothetical protein